MKSNTNPNTQEKKQISFVKEGEKKPQSQNEEKTCYLDGASDWRLHVDLDGKLKVPAKVAETNLRPTYY